MWVGRFDGAGNEAFVGREAAAPLFFRIADSLPLALPAPDLARLAEGLDRSHAQVVDHLETERTESELVVRLQTKSHPELELWAANRHAAPLIKELGRPLRFESPRTV